MSTPNISPRAISPQDFGKVAVLMGGWSAERQVSIWSGEGVHAALLSLGIDAHAVDVSGPEVLFGLKAQGFSRVFNILHGTGGEDGTVQAILDVLGLPYPGSGVRASAIAMDKLSTKRIWRAEGLPTPDFRIIDDLAEAHAAAAAFGYPFIIKPAADGSSVGVSKVKTAEQIADALALAKSANRNVVMAERFVQGGEFTCPIVGNTALPVIRIVPDGEFYDFHAKYVSDQTRYHCPAGLSPKLEAHIQQLALRAFALVGCKDWGRVDFLMGEDQQPQLLELNTLPGMTSHSLVPMAAQVAGMSYAQLCWALMETTLCAPP